MVRARRKRAAIPAAATLSLCSLQRPAGGSTAGTAPHLTTAPRPTHHPHAAATLAAVFRLFDMDGDGHISRDDLCALLALTVGTAILPATVEEIISRTIAGADADGDGRISFEDFEQVRGRGRCWAPFAGCRLRQWPYPRVRPPLPHPIQSTLSIAWQDFVVPVKRGREEDFFQGGPAHEAGEER